MKCIEILKSKWEERRLFTLVKEIEAYLNTESGGHFYIGSKMNDKMIGIEESMVDKTIQKVKNLIENQILPDCTNYVDVRCEVANGKHLISIGIHKGKELHYLKRYGMTSKGCHFMIGDKCKKMTIEEINQRRWISKFESTVPKVDDRYDDVVSIINKEIIESDVYNIGIVAPYGAGKSSAIKTYLDSLTATEKRKICYVSVANFGSMLDSNIHSKVKKVEKMTSEQKTEDGENHLTEKKVFEENSNYIEQAFDEQNIEKSVLQQIFYQNTSFAVRDSQFKNLIPFRRRYWYIGALLTGFIASVVFVVLQFFSNPFFIATPQTRNYVCWGIFVMDTIFLFLISIHIVKKNLIKKIKVSEVEFEKNDANEISVFNRYIDEIIFRFKKLKYNLVVIEDLDRFNNHKIFVKLKELCTIINSNDLIKKKIGKVTFIYAVKDSMFKNEEERSKFFDVIIPIIPIISENNMRDSLQSAVDAKFKDYKINSDFLNDISLYIDNKRIQTNVLNDFLLYTQELKNVKDPTQLFALMILKNIDSIEFENLQKRKDSIIYNELFIKRNTIIADITAENKKTLEDTEIKINENNKALKEVYFTEAGIQKIILGMLCELEQNYIRKVAPISSCDPNTIIKYENHVYGYGNPNRQISVGDLCRKIMGDSNYLNNHYEQYKNRLLKENESLLAEKNKLIKEKIAIENLSYMELSEKYPSHFAHLKNGFFRFVLCNGYIKEDYCTCLSNNDENRFDLNDQEIIASINNKIIIGIDKRINDSRRVILRLNSSRFKSKYVMNYYILDTLFKNHEKRLEPYRKSVVEYLRVNYQYKDVLNEIFNSSLSAAQMNTLCKEFVENVDESVFGILRDEYCEKLSDKDYSFILSGNEAKFNSMNEKGQVSNYLSETNEYDFNAISPDSFSKLFNTKKILIKNVCRIVNSDLLQCIVNHNAYSLSYDNVIYLLETLFSFTREKATAETYNCIKNSQDENFKKYIFDNFNDYIPLLYSSCIVHTANEEDVLELLMNEKITLDNKNIIINKESTSVKYTKDLSQDIINVLMSTNKLIINQVKDVLILFQKCDKEVFKKYFVESGLFNVIKECINKESFVELKDFVLREISIEDGVKYFSDNSVLINENIKNDNIKLLIENGKVIYSLSYLEVLEGKNLDSFIFCFKDEILNDLRKNLDDIVKLSKIILSESISSEEKSRFIKSMDDASFTKLIVSDYDLYEYIKKLSLTRKQREIVTTEKQNVEPKIGKFSLW